MQYVKTRAGNVAVHVQGEGAPLVLLHSIAHDHHDYDDVIPTLARDFRTFAVDWPGHGESEMWSPPTSARVGLLCDALEDLVDGLALGPAIVMGNSVGGTAAVRLAARRKERVRALVLVDSGGSAEISALVRTLCWVQGREVVRRLTGLSFARTYLKTRGPGRDRVLSRMVAQRERAGFIQMDAAMWRSFGTAENDLSEAARQVQVPTLIVWGQNDPVIRRSVEGKRLRELISHAEYTELPCGHAPFVEMPEAFIEAVSPFLAANKASGWKRDDMPCTTQ